MVRMMQAVLLGLATIAPAIADDGPAKDQTFGPRPIYPNSWFEKQDYPPSAIANHKGGITRYALSIDARGKPYRCAIVQSSGWDDLDTRACQLLLQRGHFVPAKDKDGSPLPSRWANSINWWMFGTDQEPPVADVDLTVKALPGLQRRVMFAVVQTVAADGTIERCRAISSSHVTAIDAQACHLAEALAMQGPITDLQDHPVRGIRVAKIAVTPEEAAH